MNDPAAMLENITSKIGLAPEMKIMPRVTPKGVKIENTTNSQVA